MHDLTSLRSKLWAYACDGLWRQHFSVLRILWHSTLGKTLGISRFHIDPHWRLEAALHRYRLPTD